MSRFARWPPWAAGLLLLVVVCAVGLAAVPTRTLASGPATVIGDDRALYRAITERVAGGEDYYQAAAIEQRARGYPMAPAQVFREPTLSWWLAVLRFEWLQRGVLVSLALAVVWIARARFEEAGLNWPARIAATAFLGLGFSFVVAPGHWLVHEAWAEILIGLALVTYRPQRWVVSALLVLAACLFRELAAPVFAVMGVAAFLERRHGEAAGWAFAFVVFDALYALHLHVAAGLYHPGDASSPGWLGLGGLPFVIETLRRNPLLDQWPVWAIAPVAAASLLGLSAWRSALGLRVALIVGGYMAAFLIVGRPNNSYWGLLYAPLLPLGLVFFPAAVRDLGRASLTRILPARA